MTRTHAGVLVTCALLLLAGCVAPGSEDALTEEDLLREAAAGTGHDADAGNGDDAEGDAGDEEAEPREASDDADAGDASNATAPPEDEETGTESAPRVAHAACEGDVSTIGAFHHALPPLADAFGLACPFADAVDDAGRAFEVAIVEATWATGQDDAVILGATLSLTSEACGVSLAEPDPEDPLPDPGSDACDFEDVSGEEAPLRLMVDADTLTAHGAGNLTAVLTFDGAGLDVPAEVHVSLFRRASDATERYTALRE